MMIASLDTEAFDRKQRDRWRKAERSLQYASERLSDTQGDVERSVKNVMEQVGDLIKRLPPEQVLRFKRAEGLVKQRLLMACMEDSAKKLGDFGHLKPVSLPKTPSSLSDKELRRWQNDVDRRTVDPHKSRIEGIL